MRTVVVALTVPADTDIFDLHDTLVETHGDENVVVYEDAEAFVKDQPNKVPDTMLALADEWENDPHSDLTQRACAALLREAVNSA
jgi:hypothetical protein